MLGTVQHPVVGPDGGTCDMTSPLITTVKGDPFTHGDVSSGKQIHFNTVVSDDSGVGGVVLVYSLSADMSNANQMPLVCVGQSCTASIGNPLCGATSTSAVVYFTITASDAANNVAGCAANITTVTGSFNVSGSSGC